MSGKRERGGCIWTEKREEILDRGFQISPQTQLHVLPWPVEGDGLQTSPTLVRPEQVYEDPSDTLLGVSHNNDRFNLTITTVY